MKKPLFTKYMHIWYPRIFTGFQFAVKFNEILDQIDEIIHEVVITTAKQTTVKALADDIDNLEIDINAKMKLLMDDMEELANLVDTYDDRISTLENQMNMFSQGTTYSDMESHGFVYMV